VQKAMLKNPLPKSSTEKGFNNSHNLVPDLALA
jgi:hypothetical protein